MKYEEVGDAVVYKLSSVIDELALKGVPPMIMDSGVPRSGGLHLTQITSSMAGYGDRDESSTEGTERMALGFAWEHLLSWAIGQVFHQTTIEDAGILIHTGEIELESIKMSPDCVWMYDDLLEEWKATWKSSNKTPEDYTLWRWQSMAYCLALGMNKVRMRVLHINGSYHRGEGKCKDGPCVKTWLIEYTDEELAQNWRNIKSHARIKGWLK